MKISETKWGKKICRGWQRLALDWLAFYQYVPANTFYWIKNALVQNRYPQISAEELLKTRKTDTVFIFGSGYSINDITDEDWRFMAQYDTFGFNRFVHQKKIRIDYHLIREVALFFYGKTKYESEYQLFSDLLKNNPAFGQAILLLQDGWRAVGSNKLIGDDLIPRHHKIYRFQTAGRDLDALPSESWDRGFVHAAGTLSDCVNFAFLMGWRRIVLVGIDLYDRRYFWLKEAETNFHDEILGASYQDLHNTAKPTIHLMGRWKDFLQERGVQLFVYNPKSLLTEVLPVFDIKNQGADKPSLDKTRIAQN